MQTIALINQGEAYRELGNYELAQVTATKALELAEAVGYQRGKAIVLVNLSLIGLALGRHEQALANIERALTIAREIRARQTEAGALLRLGLIQTETGEFDAAEQALIMAQSIADELGEELSKLKVQAALANLALARGGRNELDKALAYLNELLPLLFREQSSEESQLLPLGLYLTCIRVLQAQADPRAEQLIIRAEAELRARSDKITDAALRRGYLNIAEHRALTALAS